MSKSRDLRSALDQWIAKVRKRHASARYWRNGGTPERVARRVRIGTTSVDEEGTALIGYDDTDAHAQGEDQRKTTTLGPHRSGRLVQTVPSPSYTRKVTVPASVDR